MDNKQIEKYISNPTHYENDPDGIYFFDKEYNYRVPNSICFSYIQLPDKDRPELFFGEESRSHNLIRNEIILKYRQRWHDNFEKLDELFDGFITKAFERLNTNKTDAINSGIRKWLMRYENNGRYFLISANNIKVCIFTFWSVADYEDNVNSIDIRNIIELIMPEDNRIKKCDYILIANNDKPFYVYDDKSKDDFFKIDDNSINRAIHLASNDEKREFFKDFRNTRDKELGKKLMMSNGSEMPMAQYNALRYVDESKNMESKRIFITEAQFDKIMLSEWYPKKKKEIVYSPNDKLELVNDPNVVNGGNFPIKRNGKEYWISRSMTVGVYVYCQDENGIIYTLASKRGPKVHVQRNLWNAPCGYLEYGDSIKETAVKECWEETGVKIPIEKLVYLGENSEYSRNSDVKHTFYCVLDGVINDYQPSINNCEPGEVTDVRWIPLEELNKYKFVGQQAMKLYNIGTKLFKRAVIYKTNKDYATIIQSLQNMLSSGIIDNKQVARIKDTLNI